MKASIVGGLLLAFTALAPASAEEFSRETHIGKAKIKVVLNSVAPEGRATGPARNPRLGVAPSALGEFTNFVTRSLDDSSRVQVTSPSRLVSDQMPAAFSFDAVTRSELRDALTSACAKGKLDYALVFGASTATMKTDVTVFIVGLGRNRQRLSYEARVYDCRTKSIVWNQNVMVEGSQGMFTSAVTGNMMGNQFGADGSKAAAAIFSDKLIADMGW